MRTMPQSQRAARLRLEELDLAGCVVGVSAATIRTLAPQLTPPEITKLLRAKVASIVGPGLWFSDMFRIYNLLRFGNLHKDHQAQLRQQFLQAAGRYGDAREDSCPDCAHEKGYSAYPEVHGWVGLATRAI